jgi:hypothetical protein
MYWWAGVDASEECLAVIADATLPRCQDHRPAPSTRLRRARGRPNCIPSVTATLMAGGARANARLGNSDYPALRSIHENRSGYRCVRPMNPPLAAFVKAHQPRWRCFKPHYDPEATDTKPRKSMRRIYAFIRLNAVSES